MSTKYPIRLNKAVYEALKRARSAALIREQGEIRRKRTRQLKRTESFHEVKGNTPDG